MPMPGMPPPNFNLPPPGYMPPMMGMPPGMGPPGGSSSNSALNLDPNQELWVETKSGEGKVRNSPF